MGIDIYATWDKITPAEQKKQITGFATAGKYGYLRGGNTTTEFLFAEAFKKKARNEWVRIPAKTLVSRISKVSHSLPAYPSYVDFITLVAKKESLGLHPKIMADY